MERRKRQNRKEQHSPFYQVNSFLFRLGFVTDPKVCVDTNWNFGNWSQIKTSSRISPIEFQGIFIFAHQNVVAVFNPTAVNRNSAGVRFFFCIEIKCIESLHKSNKSHNVSYLWFLPSAYQQTLPVDQDASPINGISQTFRNVRVRYVLNPTNNTTKSASAARFEDLEWYSLKFSKS